MILVFNKEYNDTLVEPVLFGCHGVVRVRKHPGLENGSQVLRIHAILVRLGGEDGEQVKQIKEELAVEWWQLGDQPLIF